MESCFLPIEICEKVMDALPDYVELSDDGWLLFPQYAWDSQRALCSCALTCRAWRVRAQYLLWTFPAFVDSLHLARFNTAIVTSANSAIIRGLALGSGENDDEAPDLRTAGELFKHSFPHLQQLLCANFRFDCGPPLYAFRMRQPFFSSITTLALLHCKFPSLEAFLDVVWACSNLATLAWQPNMSNTTQPCYAAEFQDLFAAVKKLRACKKLTRLWLYDGHIDNVSPSFLLLISGLLTAYYLHRNAGDPMQLESMAPGVYLGVPLRSYTSKPNVLPVCGIQSSYVRWLTFCIF